MSLVLIEIKSFRSGAPLYVVLSQWCHNVFHKIFSFESWQLQWFQLNLAQIWYVCFIHDPEQIDILTFDLWDQTWPLRTKKRSKFSKDNSRIVCYIFAEHRSSSGIKGRTFLSDGLWPPKPNLTSEVNLDLWDQN